MEQDELVRQAWEAHRAGMDFADALHLLRSEGCGSFASFDRSLTARATDPGNGQGWACHDLAPGTPGA